MSSTLDRNTNLLQKCLARAGWEVIHFDLDGALSSLGLAVDMKWERHDGRWLWARVDNLGRASFETFQRERILAMDPRAEGTCPLSPQIHDTFLGRHRCADASDLIREISAYIADNALSPVHDIEVRQALAAAMNLPEHDDVPAEEEVEEGEKKRSRASPQQTQALRRAVPAGRPASRTALTRLP